MSFTRACRVCGLPASITCSVCEQVWYCGVPHQRSDWSARHKGECFRPPPPALAASSSALPQRFSKPEAVMHRNTLREQTLELLDRRDFVSAMKKAQESLKFTQETLGQSDLDCLPDMLLLIDVVIRLKLVAEARKHLRHCREIVTGSNIAPRDKGTLLESLSRFHAQIGERVVAAQLCKEAVDISLEQVVGVSPVTSRSPRRAESTGGRASLPITSKVPKLDATISPLKWSTDHVLDWLKSIGLSRYTDNFRAAGITGEDLNLLLSMAPTDVQQILHGNLGMKSETDQSFLLQGFRICMQRGAQHTILVLSARDYLFTLVH